MDPVRWCPLSTSTNGPLFVIRNFKSQARNRKELETEKSKRKIATINSKLNCIVIYSFDLKF